MAERVKFKMSMVSMFIVYGVSMKEIWNGTSPHFVLILEYR